VDELTSIGTIAQPQDPPIALSDNTATFLKVEREIPVRKGKWRLLAAWRRNHNPRSRPA
jgi:hypothetical protein